jgi:hypothetical protein
VATAGTGTASSLTGVPGTPQGTMPGTPAAAWHAGTGGPGCGRGLRNDPAAVSARVLAVHRAGTVHRHHRVPDGGWLAGLGTSDITPVFQAVGPRALTSFRMRVGSFTRSRS